MVATSHPLATAAGLEVLSAGGNAVDAALAASAVQAVTDPLMTGVGGDCFVLYAPAGGAVRALNGSGRAPAGASVEAFRAAGVGDAIAQTSPHAVTVPGAVAAWCRLHADAGSLPLEEVFARAIDYATGGFPVTARVAADWADHAGVVAQNAPHFLPGGQPPAAGARFTQPALGRLLHQIAHDGAAAFYTGAAAAAMIARLRGLGGLHTDADFADAADGADWVAPISAPYRGMTVYECPPNGQGLAALMILRILEGFDLGPDLTLADRIHLHTEATKLAYHHRDALIADPAISAGLADTLLSDNAIAALRARIRMDRASPPALWDEPEHRDTIYLCVVDGEGNAVSFINSIFHPFGSGIHCAETGVLFQSRGASFRMDPAHPNAIGARKRPMHTIIPGMIAGPGLAHPMPFGVMGGHYQAAGHAQFVSAITDLGLGLQEAIDAPRHFAHDSLLEVERTIPAAIRDDLAARGHVVVEKGPMGGAQAIRRDAQTGMLEGGSDSRKDGAALGF